MGRGKVAGPARPLRRVEEEPEEEFEDEEYEEEEAGSGRKKDSMWPLYAAAAIILGTVLVIGFMIYNQTRTPEVVKGPDHQKQFTQATDIIRDVQAIYSKFSDAQSESEKMEWWRRADEKATEAMQKLDELWCQYSTTGDRDGPLKAGYEQIEEVYTQLSRLIYDLNHERPVGMGD